MPPALQCAAAATVALEAVYLISLCSVWRLRYCREHEGRQKIENEV